ncbi:MAG TPA: SMP-30/gluconolactonase/LRE family protein [Polyangiaceae bacterium]|nr:SMP-30/gluconolactonase/LRE family protein [Polyangiaceae bacterium]
MLSMGTGSMTLRLLLISAMPLLLACGNDNPMSDPAASGGSGNGGSSAGGASSGGVSIGGSAVSGGVSSGGGGASGGGVNAGGTASGLGGTTSGGAPSDATGGGTTSGGGETAGGMSGLGGGVNGGSTSVGGASTGGAGSGGAGGRARCPAGPFPAPVVQSSKSVCADFDFNYNFDEGPTWIASQNAFFFTNFVVRAASGGDIIKYTPGGSCEVFIAGVGCNGLAVSNDGNLLAACHQSRSVIRFDVATKQPTTIASVYMGMLLDTPNDLVMHSNGTIFFTNPDYELAGRPRGVGLSVFRIDPAGTLSRIAQTACNGIGLSPDESKLYVLQAGVWDVNAEAVPSNRSTLFTGGDGMAVDCAGNLYASGAIFSATGERLGEYGAGTNLAFGGLDGKTVLVAGRNTDVRELQMNVPGLP